MLHVSPEIGHVRGGAALVEGIPTFAAAEVMRGLGGIKAVLMAGRPMRSTWVPLTELVIQTPSRGGVAVVSFVVGTSRSTASVLALRN